MHKIIQFLCLISLAAGSAHAMMTKQETLNHLLMDAATVGDVAWVKKEIRDGADVNTRDVSGKTPLMKAAKYGHSKVCKYLIARKANINAQTIRTFPLRTALIYAAKRGHLDICKMLLANKADPNIQNDYLDCTPLMWAAKKGHFDIYKELLANKADIHLRNNHGWNALMFAAYNGHIAMCLYGGNPVDIADINAKDKVGVTPLMLAALNNQTDTCQHLISNGADVNARTIEGRTALIYAGCSDHIRTCTYLIDVMLQPNKQDVDAATTLLGIRRFRITTDLSPLDINLVKIVVQHVINAKKQDVIAQINRLKQENAETKQLLMEYVNSKLNSPKKKIVVDPASKKCLIQ